MSDCLLLNPYEGIKMVSAARHWIRGVTGHEDVQRQRRDLARAGNNKALMVNQRWHRQPH